MSRVVVKDGKLKCSHGGEASFGTGSPKLRVKGKEVVISGMEAVISFAATCPYKVGNNPSPCTATMPATSGSISKKIRVNEQGVLLDTGRGQPVNLGDPGATWEVSEAGQNILRASS
jgi:hypothetical protein